MVPVGFLFTLCSAWRILRNGAVRLSFCLNPDDCSRGFSGGFIIISGTTLLVWCGTLIHDISYKPILRLHIDSGHRDESKRH